MNDDLIIVDEEDEEVVKPKQADVPVYNTDDLLIVEEEEEEKPEPKIVKKVEKKAESNEKINNPIINKKEVEEKIEEDIAPKIEPQKKEANEKITNPFISKSNNASLDEEYLEVTNKVEDKVIKPKEESKKVDRVIRYNSNQRGTYNPELDESITSSVNSQGINKYVHIKYGKMAYWLCIPIITLVIMQALFNQFSSDFFVNEINMKNMIVCGIYVPVFFISLVQMIYSKKFITHNPVAFVVSTINLITSLACAVIGLIGIDIFIDNLLIVVYSTTGFYALTSVILMIANKSIFKLVYVSGVTIVDLVAYEIDEAYGKEDRVIYEKKVRSLSYKKEFVDLNTYVDNTHRRYLSRREYMLPLGNAVTAIDQICAAATKYDGKRKAKSIRKILMSNYKKRNYGEINQYRNEYLVKYEAYLSNIRSGYGMVEEIVQNDGNGTFSGNHIKLVVMRLVSLVVSVITIFFAAPAMLCWIERWKCKNTYYEGKKLFFDGKASQLLGKWLKWLFLSIVTVGLFIFAIPGKMRKWKAQNTHIRGEYRVFGGTYDGDLFYGIFSFVRTVFLSIISLGLLTPYAICISKKYKLRHTIYDGKRLIFDGKATDLLSRSMKWVLLSIVTLGIHTFYIPGKMKKWIASNIKVSVCTENVKK